jgi:RND family efflux transporter MFP subunit
LTTIVSVDPMYVYFDVNERAFQGYQKILEKAGKKTPHPTDKPATISPGDFPVQMALATDDEFPYKGYIDFVDNRVDPATGSKKIRAVFDNPILKDGRRRLSPGLFARVQFSLVPAYDAILVADRAILTDQNLKYVLVVDKDDKNTVKRVDVVPAARLQKSGLRAIEAGLKGDEWVIVEGVNRARPGVPVAPKTGPMPHRPAVNANP